MIEQTIIQAALTSIETLDVTKSKLEAWTEFIKNAVQISGQNAVHIAFTKLTGSPLLTANRLKTRSPKHGWNLKRNYQCNTLSLNLIPMQPKLSLIWNKVQMSFSTTTWIV